MDSRFIDSSGVRGIVDRLVRAWCLSYSWVLEYCKLEEHVVELCEKFRNAMELFMRGNNDYALGVVPCQIVDGDEYVGAVYLSIEDHRPPYLLLVSYTILGDTTYAGFTLLHEIAHHLGFDDEDLADFIAALVVNENIRGSLSVFLEEPPITVRQGINGAVRDGRICDVRDLDRLLEDTGFIRVHVFNCNDV